MAGGAGSEQLGGGPNRGSVLPAPKGEACRQAAIGGTNVTHVEWRIMPTSKGAAGLHRPAGRDLRSLIAAVAISQSATDQSLLPPMSRSNRGAVTDLSA